MGPFGASGPGSVGAGASVPKIGPKVEDALGAKVVPKVVPSVAAGTVAPKVRKDSVVPKVVPDPKVVPKGVDSVP